MGAISAAEFFGGTINFSFGTTDTPICLSHRVWRVTATAGSLRLRFPPNTTPGIPLGSPVFVIANVGTNNFNYRDAENNDPALTLAVGRAVVVGTYMLSGQLRWSTQAPTLFYTSY